MSAVNAEVVIAADRLSATLTLPAGQIMDAEALRSAVDAAGIRHGLNPAALRSAMKAADEERCLLIARGAPAEPGRGPALVVRVKAQPDGSVLIESPMVVGLWSPGATGRSGLGVDGMPVLAQDRPGERLGSGLVVDGDEVRAEVPGALVRDGEGVWAIVDPDAAVEPRRREGIDVEIEPDGMKASFLLRANEYILPDDLKRCILAAGIRHGIDATALRQAMRAGILSRRIVIALGTAPEHGRDARLEHLIDDAPTYAVKPDGSLDFHEANRFKEVAIGAELARLHPPTIGHPGMTVQGKTVPANPGRELPIERFVADGAVISPAEPDVIVAQREGVLHRERDGRVSVREILIIDGNVDMRTGNIATRYAVHVRGDVSAGFSVKSESDIHVDGVIEDARVSAQGNLTVGRGILPGRNRVKAHGDVVAPYIRERAIKARDVVVAKSIRFCTVMATGQIAAHEILGGQLIAAASVRCDQLGGEDEQETTVQVGEDPFKRSVYEAALATIRRIDQGLDALKMRVESAAHRSVELSNKCRIATRTSTNPEYLRGLIEQARDALEDSRSMAAQLQAELAGRSEAAAQVDDYLADGSEAALADVTVTVAGTCHARVDILFGRHLRLAVDRAMRGPRFHVADGRIEV